MSETIKWSFSADRCFRRCQRQYFLTHVAAHHSAKDTVRREAFLAKQVKTLELWQGTLVHLGLEKYVSPCWQQKQEIDWPWAINETQRIAKQQFAFSAAHRYRENGLTKTKAGDNYCALAGHESDSGVSEAELDGVFSVIDKCFRNLSRMTDLLGEIRLAGQVWAELPLYITYDAARLEVHLDLMFFRDFGKPTIVDWKVSDSMGGSDADLQTGLYAWAMCQHPKWQVSEPEDCELVEVQLLTNDVIRHRVDAVLFDQIENRIYRSVDMIRSLRLGRKFTITDIEDYEFAGNPNSCSFCSMSKLCQSLAHKQRRGELVAAPETSRRKHREDRDADSCPKLF